MFTVEKSYVDGVPEEKQIVGPSDATRTFDEIKNCGAAFRMADGDGELYFTGHYVGENQFEPLDCYGRAFGCTEIQYYDHGWKSL